MSTPCGSDGDTSVSHGTDQTLEEGLWDGFPGSDEGGLKLAHVRRPLLRWQGPDHTVENIPCVLYRVEIWADRWPRVDERDVVVRKRHLRHSSPVSRGVVLLESEILLLDEWKCMGCQDVVDVILGI